MSVNKNIPRIDIPIKPLSYDDLRAILLKFGFKLYEDDHTVELCYGAKVVQRFNATSVTTSAILYGAQDYLETGRWG